VGDKVLVAFGRGLPLNKYYHYPNPPDLIQHQSQNGEVRNACSYLCGAG
jgi:hypothetical protein